MSAAKRETFGGRRAAIMAMAGSAIGPLKDFHILGNTLFDFCDKLSSNFVMTPGSLLFVLFVGWKMKKKDVYDELTCGGRLRYGKVFKPVCFLIRRVAPITIVVIFLSNILIR